MDIPARARDALNRSGSVAIPRMAGDGASRPLLRVPTKVS